MCGIAGGWWQERTPAVENGMARALAAMQRRGPDDRGFEFTDGVCGVLGLGHTRLSIIDLSAAGHQPMHAADGRTSIVFNGEIYNYRELRQELRALGHVFTSESDTEVLLAAWRQWNRACLPRLLGMFSFAVHDAAARTLTCVRDPFGIKPLFYASDAASFVFASEPAAILALRPGRPALDWQRAYDYLVHADYDSSDRTFLEGVRHLVPGHLIELDLRTGVPAAPQRWWHPNIDETSRLGLDEAAERVRTLFLDSVRMHLRSDVRVGAALSGGIDSSAVVCAIRHLEPDLPIHTFSYVAHASAISEEVWVDRVNARVGAVPHKVSLSREDLARDLDDMIRAQGEPFGSTSIYAQFRVFRLAREHGVTVTLDGQGADEMLAGYNGYPGQRIRSLLDQGAWMQAWRFLEAWAQWPGRSRRAGLERAVAALAEGRLQELLRELRGMTSTPAWIDARALRERGVACRYPVPEAVPSFPGRRVMSELATSLTARGLPALLRHGDRNSMWFSVESRVPFLTLPMVELLLSLPESHLISPHGETKRVFRAAMRGIVPDEILDRRDKIGFETPERDWILGMAGTVRRWLEVDLGVDLLDRGRMLAHFDDVVGGRRPFSWQVWRWICFCRWYTHIFS